MKLLPSELKQLKLAVKRISGQILVTTLIILMLVSLTVVVITATVAKNNRQVFNNLEYEKSYNYAESRLISAADTLANPDFELFSLTTTVGQQALGSGTCEALVGNTKYYCAYDEEEGARRTLLTVEETNKVVAYDLGSDEYFDIILFRTNTDTGYRNPVRIAWLGQTALELNLIYLDSANQIKSITEIVDPTSGSNQIFTGQGKPTSGFLTTGRVTASGSETVVNLQNVDAAKTGPNAKLRYLRVKVVNKQAGATISIQPVQDDDLPNQVRRVEALSYLKSEVESSAPVVSTQLPLSPPVAPNLADSLNFHAIRQPMCGNGIVEGSEVCDDGNTVDSDQCGNTCGGYRYMTLFYGNNGSLYHYVFTEGVGFSSVDDLTYTGAQDGKSDAEIFAAIDTNDLIMIKTGNGNAATLQKFIDYAISKQKVVFTNFGDNMDCWTGHSVLYRYGIFSSRYCTWNFPDPYNLVTGFVPMRPTADSGNAFKYTNFTNVGVPEVTPGWQDNYYFNNLWHVTPNIVNWRPAIIGSPTGPLANLSTVLHPDLGSQLTGCTERKYTFTFNPAAATTVNNCTGARFYPGIPCQTITTANTDQPYPQSPYAYHGHIQCAPVPQTKCMMTYLTIGHLCMWWRTKFPNGAELHFLGAEVGFAWKAADPKEATAAQKVAGSRFVARTLTNVLMEQDGKPVKYNTNL